MTNELEHQALLNTLFAAIDNKDTGRFLSCIAPDATFRFGSAPAIAGHDAIRSAVDGFFATIAGLQHAVKKTVANGSMLVSEGEVTYTRHDDSRITLPFANIFQMQDGLITEYKIYIDIALLYAEV